MMIVSKKKIDIEKFIEHMNAFNISCEFQPYGMDIIFPYGKVEKLPKNIKKIINTAIINENIPYTMENFNKLNSELWVARINTDTCLEGNKLFFSKEEPLSFPESFVDSEEGCMISIQIDADNYLNIDYDTNQQEYIKKFFSSMLKLSEYFEED